ncbi:DUF4190 domain-containing protein [Micrococcaceae bacterium Sec7.4]
MTDQPKPEKGEAPEGYQPPSFIPGQESGEQYRPPAPDYSPPTEPYATPYGTAPQQAPGAGGQQQYGQQPYGATPQYGQPGGPFNAYGQPAYYGVPPEPKGLSIASMCCGIAAFVGLGIFLLPQLAAVILGHLALRREPSGRGMAIAGLVLGYVGIALTILVIVIIALGLAIGTSTRMRYGA